jgi:hypothetical protein
VVGEVPAAEADREVKEVRAAVRDKVEEVRVKASAASNVLNPQTRNAAVSGVLMTRVRPGAS